MSGSSSGFSITSIRLVSLNARGSSATAKRGTATVARQTSYSVLEANKDGAVVLFAQRIYLKPAGPLQLDLEFHVFCSVPEGLSDADIVRLVREHAYPIYAEVTLIVGIISERMLGTPLLVPPALDGGTGVD